jgi:hypothetical protein
LGMTRVVTVRDYTMRLHYDLRGISCNLKLCPAKLVRKNAGPSGLGARIAVSSSHSVVTSVETSALIQRVTDTAWAPHLHPDALSCLASFWQCHSLPAYHTDGDVPACSRQRTCVLPCTHEDQQVQPDRDSGHSGLRKWG